MLRPLDFLSPKCMSETLMTFAAETVAAAAMVADVCGADLHSFLDKAVGVPLAAAAAANRAAFVVTLLATRPAAPTPPPAAPEYKLAGGAAAANTR